MSFLRITSRAWFKQEERKKKGWKENPCFETFFFSKRIWSHELILSKVLQRLTIWNPTLLGEKKKIKDDKIMLGYDNKK